MKILRWILSVIALIVLFVIGAVALAHFMGYNVERVTECLDSSAPIHSAELAAQIYQELNPAVQKTIPQDRLEELIDKAMRHER